MIGLGTIINTAAVVAGGFLGLMLKNGIAKRFESILMQALGLATVFIGAGGVSFYQVMPTYHNPTGKKAYIMNMYTAPEYRRQGIAIHTLDLLVNDAREQGVSQIALEATDMGRALYEKYGFVKMEDEMELV